MSVKRSSQPASPVTYRGRRGYCQEITIVHEDMCRERERERAEQSETSHAAFVILSSHFLCVGRTKDKRREREIEGVIVRY